MPTWTPPWRRGLPERPAEDPVVPGSGAPQQLSSVLDGLLGSGPWRMGLIQGELGRRWEEVVGQPLAAESAPVGLDERGLLTVRASTAAWAAQLRFLKAQVCDNANGILGSGAVRDVRVVLGSEGRRGAGNGV